MLIVDSRFICQSCCQKEYFLQIADFGVAHDLVDNDYYLANGGKIPVKWTAPEVSSIKLRAGLELEHQLFF